MLFLRTLISSLLLFSLSSQIYAQDTSEQIENLFERYLDAWNRGDLEAIGNEIYRAPVYIFESESTQIFSTGQEIADLLGQLRIQLDSEGFSRSELRGVSNCDLGGGLAFASFHYLRFDKSGKQMDEQALSSAYIVRQSEDGWHLVAHVMQEQPSTLSC